MAEHSFHLNVTMPKAVFDQEFANTLFALVYQKHRIVLTDQTTANVCVTFSYTNETAFDMICVLASIYDAAGKQSLSVDFCNQQHDIQSNTLHKMILIMAGAQNDNALTSAYRLNSIIKNRNITDLDMLKALPNEPFSGIMVYDHLDYFSITHKLDYLLQPKTPPAQIEEYSGDFILSNRYITQDILINKRHEANIQNCIITGNIELSSVEKISFWNCVIVGKITCFGSSKISIVECNASHFLIYNCHLSKFTLSLSKIYRLEMHSSSIDVLEMYNNEVVQPYLANLKLPDTKIDAGQFNFRNISPRIIRKKRGTPNERFFLTYQLNKKEKKVTPADIAIDTVETLLNNGSFGNDYHTLANLKYKKSLYSNTGLKKFFIFITGGFFFPSRWITYLVVLTILFALIYWRIPSGFVSTIDGAFIQLNYITALHYSLLQIIGANTLPIISKGLCQILTVIHATLNTAIIANFFASIIKKYMDN